MGGLALGRGVLNSMAKCRRNPRDRGCSSMIMRPLGIAGRPTKQLVAGRTRASSLAARCSGYDLPTKLPARSAVRT